MFPDTPVLQYFSGMVGSSLIEHNMADRDKQLIIPTAEAPSQGPVAGLCDHAFAHPFPKLFLGDPVFLAIVTND